MYTIGEFSRLCRVSARMLRHYDAVGLLRPALVGENGYRYYAPEQLSDLMRIETLKGYGFTLAQIVDLLPLKPPELAVSIHKRRLEAYGELNDMRRRLRQMEEAIFQMEAVPMYKEKYDVVTMTDPACRVFCLRRTINISEIHDLFQDLFDQMKKKGLTRCGASQAVYHGDTFSYDHADIEAQVMVSGEAEGVVARPEQLCAAVTHTGPYDTVKYAYDALCAWISEHPQYRVCGPAVERYLRDENMVSNLEEMETGILFPIAEVQP